MQLCAPSVAAVYVISRLMISIISLVLSACLIGELHSRQYIVQSTGLR